jgi:hypothetical protein
LGLEAAVCWFVVLCLMGGGPESSKLRCKVVTLIHKTLRARRKEK